MLFHAYNQVLKGPTYVPAITLPALKVYINIYTTGRLGKYGSSCLFSLLQPTSSEESAEETCGDYSESIDSEADSEAMAAACTSTISGTGIPVLNEEDFFKTCVKVSAPRCCNKVYA